LEVGFSRAGSLLWRRERRLDGSEDSRACIPSGDLLFSELFNSVEAAVCDNFGDRGCWGRARGGMGNIEGCWWSESDGSMGKIRRIPPHSRIALRQLLKQHITFITDLLHAFTYAQYHLRGFWCAWLELHSVFKLVFWSAFMGHIYDCDSCLVLRRWYRVLEWCMIISCTHIQTWLFLYLLSHDSDCRRGHLQFFWSWFGI
jgi:hypothetical protein